MEKPTYEQLENFYKAVASLTLNHDTLTSDDGGINEDYAVVFPTKLGFELEKVYADWWKAA